MLSIPIDSLQAAFAGMQALGLSLGSFEAATGLTFEQAQEPLVSNRAWLTLWESAERVDSKPLLPIRVAQAVPFGAFGILDYYVATAPTLQDGLQTLTQVFPTLGDGTQIVLTSDNPASMRLRLLLPPQGTRHKELFTLAVLLDRFRAVTQGAFRPTRIYVTQTPRYRAAFVDLFTADVIFNTVRAGFDFPASQVQTPIAHADAQLHSALQRQLFSAIPASHASGDMLCVVHGRIASLLSKSACSLQAVVASMGMSPRTLLRRLRHQNSTLQQATQVVRVELAQTLLAEGELSMADIAHRLGYAEQSAWSRAFARSVGVSPSIWRRDATKYMERK